MRANSIFLDANILLEVILGRSKEQSARRFIKTHSDNLRISALTVHLVVHFGQTIVDLTTLRKFLSDYEVLSLDSADFEWAFINIRGKDYEDALQLAVAIRNGCNKFVTLDKSVSSLYSALPSIETMLLT